jgi:hypothetical protein
MRRVVGHLILPLTLALSPAGARVIAVPEKVV